MKPRPKIIVLCGPTAVGKTSCAIRLSLAVQGEIVNADSMQIYRYMDIGTAKPTEIERQRVRHHLLDIADPDEPFDAAKYAAAAQQVIQTLNEKDIVPILTGGTGLYIKALVNGLFEMAPSDPQVRERLLSTAETIGVDRMYDRLREIDPEAASKLHPHDNHRIIRALEVYEITGKPISLHQKRHGFSDQPYQVLKIGLMTDRESLYRRIDSRVCAMMEEGFLDEVKKLLAMGYEAGLKSMQSIGYRHLTDYIQGRMDWEETIRTLKRDTRRYAKRQMTWFGRDGEVLWKTPDEAGDIIRMAEEFLNSGQG